jgi:hypothetical protein
MTPYCTIHAAPLGNILSGIVADIPRYEREMASVYMSRPSLAKGHTPFARKMQARILEVIRNGGKVSTKMIVKALDSNRFSVYNNASALVADGVVRLVKRGNKDFYWEAIA